jgi:hypothetical protein
MPTQQTVRLMIAISSFWLMTNSLRADSPGLIEPFVKTSEGGSCFVSVIPSGESEESDETATYTIYRLQENGSFDKLFSLTRNYAWPGELFLSNDGLTIIFVNTLPWGEKPERDHWAVEFYREGKKIKSYSVTDLVKNANSVTRTASHYFWLKQDTIIWESDSKKLTQSEYLSSTLRIEDHGSTDDHSKQLFIVPTVDNQTHRFQLTDGEIVNEVEKAEQHSLN